MLFFNNVGFQNLIFRIYIIYKYIFNNSNFCELFDVSKSNFIQVQ